MTVTEGTVPDGDTFNIVIAGIAAAESDHVALLVTNFDTFSDQADVTTDGLTFALSVDFGYPPVSLFGPTVAPIAARPNTALRELWVNGPGSTLHHSTDWGTSWADVDASPLTDSQRSIAVENPSGGGGGARRRGGFPMFLS